MNGRRFCYCGTVHKKGLWTRYYTTATNDLNPIPLFSCAAAPSIRPPPPPTNCKTASLALLHVKALLAAADFSLVWLQHINKRHGLHHHPAIASLSTPAFLRCDETTTNHPSAGWYPDWLSSNNKGAFYGGMIIYLVITIITLLDGTNSCITVHQWANVN